MGKYLILLIAIGVVNGFETKPKWVSNSREGRGKKIKTRNIHGSITSYKTSHTLIHNAMTFF